VAAHVAVGFVVVIGLGLPGAPTITPPAGSGSPMTRAIGLSVMSLSSSNTMK
jgi:hypothetical protein